MLECEFDQNRMHLEPDPGGQAGGAPGMLEGVFGQNGVHLKVLILYGHHGFLKSETSNFGLRETRVTIKSNLSKLVTIMVHLT